MLRGGGIDEMGSPLAIGAICGGVLGVASTRATDAAICGMGMFSFGGGLGMAFGGKAGIVDADDVLCCIICCGGICGVCAEVAPRNETGAAF